MSHTTMPHTQHAPQTGGASGTTPMMAEQPPLSQKQPKQQRVASLRGGGSYREGASPVPVNLETTMVKAEPPHNGGAMAGPSGGPSMLPPMGPAAAGGVPLHGGLHGPGRLLSLESCLRRFVEPEAVGVHDTWICSRWVYSCVCGCVWGVVCKCTSRGIVCRRGLCCCIVFL